MAIPRSPRPRDGSAPSDGAASPGPARRFPPDTVAAAVRLLESGVPAPVVCRRFGVSDRTLYRWRRRAAGGPA